jgi:hypothetical protein
MGDLSERRNSVGSRAREWLKLKRRVNSTGWKILCHGHNWSISQVFKACYHSWGVVHKWYLILEGKGPQAFGNEKCGVYGRPLHYLLLFLNGSDDLRTNSMLFFYKITFKYRRFQNKSVHTRSLAYNSSWYELFLLCSNCRELNLILLNFQVTSGNWMPMRWQNTQMSG